MGPTRGSIGTVVDLEALSFAQGPELPGSGSILVFRKWEMGSFPRIFEFSRYQDTGKPCRVTPVLGSGADLRAHKNGKNSFRAACGQGTPDVPPWLFGHMPGCRSGPGPPGTQKNLVSLDSSIGRWGPSYLGEQPR